jgi:hypothetical protein
VTRVCLEIFSSSYQRSAIRTEIINGNVDDVGENRKKEAGLLY